MDPIDHARSFTSLPVGQVSVGPSPRARADPSPVAPPREEAAPTAPAEGRSMTARASPRGAEGLPDLTDRIERLGLGEEYKAFRARYTAWRKGEAKGARDPPLADAASSAGFGFWYPSVDEWRWKRTLSYWIAVTFFEGSIFFALSSFLFIYEEELGELAYAFTTGGYMAGNVLFFACTYLMCVETVNLTAEGSVAATASPDQEDSSDASDQSDESETGVQAFDLWPFRWRRAVANLARVGVGPWPYYASALYFSGALLFTLGLVVEPMEFLRHAVRSQVSKSAFLLGSACFFLGGIGECIENETFTSLQVTKGWLGALFNSVGGLFFTAGAAFAWVDDWWCYFLYGVGSLTFLLGSSVMIIMWKDEQFGLTFLAVLNKLGGPRGRPMLQADLEGDPHEAHFSPCGVIFIHVYCLAGALSVYNFGLALKRATMDHFAMGRSAHLAFNESLPFVFCHMALALTSAVVRMPKIAPYRQLLLGMRLISLLLLTNSGFSFLGRLCDALKGP